MATPTSQKASERPISFVLHDTAAGAAPFVFDMVIRPEELTRTEPSRLAINQTFGEDGGFVDNFGPNLGQITLAGTTGWRGGALDDGLALMQRLRQTVFVEWHAARKRAVERGQDPSLVRLIFVDALDDFAWVCAPQQFVLRRNKARPLLASYQIQLVKLGEDVSEEDRQAAQTNGAGQAVSELALRERQAAGIESLQQSITQVSAYLASLSTTAADAIGTMRLPLFRLVDETQRALVSAVTLASAIRSAATTVVDEVVFNAALLSRAAMNATYAAQAITTLPQVLRGELQRGASAIRNAFCLLANVFGGSRYYDDYSAFFGASNCSSTWVGGTLSPYGAPGVSGIEAMFPVAAPSASVDASRMLARRELASMDVVLAPRSATWVEGRLRAAL